MTHELPSIAFIGKMGAGKTTAAELLVKHHGYQRLSFAAPLKIMCGTAAHRALLQRVGVGVRALHEDAWVNLLMDALHRNYDRGAPATVDDCRFPNEVLRLKMEDFIVVRVEASFPHRKLRLLANGKLQDESEMWHESETALDDYKADAVLSNETTPTDLMRRLDALLTRFQR